MAHKQDSWANVDKPLKADMAKELAGKKNVEFIIAKIIKNIEYDGRDYLYTNDLTEEGATRLREMGYNVEKRNCFVCFWSGAFSCYDEKWKISW